MIIIIPLLLSAVGLKLSKMTSKRKLSFRDRKWISEKNIWIVIDHQSVETIILYKQYSLNEKATEKIGTMSLWDTSSEVNLSLLFLA